MLFWSHRRHGYAAFIEGRDDTGRYFLKGYDRPFKHGPATIVLTEGTRSDIDGNLKIDTVVQVFTKGGYSDSFLVCDYPAFRSMFYFSVRDFIKGAVSGEDEDNRKDFVRMLKRTPSSNRTDSPKSLKNKQLEAYDAIIKLADFFIKEKA